MCGRRKEEEERRAEQTSEYYREEGSSHASEFSGLEYAIPPVLWQWLDKYFLLARITTENLKAKPRPSAHVKCGWVF